MTIKEFVTKLKENPKQLIFSETMSVIENNYVFTPTALKMVICKIVMLKIWARVKCFLLL